MATNIVFGDVPGVLVGTTFASYKDMNASKVHRSSMGGISGLAKVGADSLVISGGYKDDEDQGDIIVYTGQGGRDKFGKHDKDQTLKLGNAALVVSQLNGYPVRVIRGADKKNSFAPPTGYRYDGLYRIDSHWQDTGVGGFKIWRFRLEQLKTDHLVLTALTSPSIGAPPIGNESPIRAKTTIQRIVRDTTLSKALKSHYNHACQVCGLVIKTPNGFYAEAAHIKPLGAPHLGPDVWENILCLCPNHHTMFDLGVFSINDDYTLLGIAGGSFKVNEGHSPDLSYLQYHRSHYLDIAV